MVGPYKLPAFYVDRYEVTNREYQEFVDAGGYEKKEYWTVRFVGDGRELSRADAMAEFRDTSGGRGLRRGPEDTIRRARQIIRSVG